MKYVIYTNEIPWHATHLTLHETYKVFEERNNLYWLEGHERWYLKSVFTTPEEFRDIQLDKLLNQ